MKVVDCPYATKKQLAMLLHGLCRMLQSLHGWTRTVTCAFAKNIVSGSCRAHRTAQGYSSRQTMNLSNVGHTYNVHTHLQESSGQRWRAYIGVHCISAEELASVHQVAVQVLCSFICGRCIGVWHKHLHRVAHALSNTNIATGE